jgi:hypothetical protein
VTALARSPDGPPLFSATRALRWTTAIALAATLFSAWLEVPGLRTLPTPELARVTALVSGPYLFVLVGARPGRRWLSLVAVLLALGALVFLALLLSLASFSFGFAMTESDVSQAARFVWHIMLLLAVHFLMLTAAIVDSLQRRTDAATVAASLPLVCESCGTRYPSRYYFPNTSAGSICTTCAMRTLT